MGSVGSFASAAFSLAAGKAEQRAYANDEQAAYEQAELASIQADQEAINRTAQLNAQLASISASSAGGGIAIGSSSIANINRRENQLASQDVSAIKFMGNTKRRNYQLSGKASAQKGKAAKWRSYASASKSIGDGVNSMGSKGNPNAMGPT
tara:strand:+ start:63 stop:515 length:453 start_codon:yes stop_codon:yes gene_type:complete